VEAPSAAQQLPAKQSTQPQAPPTTAEAPAATPIEATTPAIPQIELSLSGEVTEDQLKQLLVGKPLYLRGGYLGDSLSFTEHGDPVGHPTAGSYTLSGVQIEKVHLTKHKVELEGSRYGLHFLGALPNEDPSIAVDRVKITPKKKILKITIDREQVVKPKKVKESGKKGAKTEQTESGSSPKEIVASSETDTASPAQTADQPSRADTTPEIAPARSNQPSEQAASPSAEEAPEQPADQAADQASVTTTTSPAHANQVLSKALDRIFSPGLDQQLKAQMPSFWQLYYQAQTDGIDYRPHDPSVLRSSAVDEQAKELSHIAPDSNEFAQANGIAGRALYRAVIGPDGKAGEVAVVRPIGFGLDENAVAAIRKATFQPALKGGQPVAETLDLAVLFRIYSKRTSLPAPVGGKTQAPILPGPYSVRER